MRRISLWSWFFIALVLCGIPDVLHHARSWLAQGQQYVLWLYAILWVWTLLLAAQDLSRKRIPGWSYLLIRIAAIALLCIHLLSRPLALRAIEFRAYVEAGLLLIASCIYSFFAGRLQRRRIRQQFFVRTPLTIEDIYSRILACAATFPAESGRIRHAELLKPHIAVVEHVWQDIAVTLEIDPSKLYPEDRLDTLDYLPTPVTRRGRSTDVLFTRYGFITSKYKCDWRCFSTIGDLTLFLACCRPEMLEVSDAA